MQKYIKIFTLSAVHNIRNYKALTGLSIFIITCLIIFAHIWKIAAAKMGAIDLHPDQLLWYIAFNEWVLVSLPGVHEDIEQDLQSGRLAYLLPRPLSYLASIFSEGLGILCVNLAVLGAVTFTFTWIWIGSLPFHPTSFPVVIAIGLLAGCVAMVFQMLVGVSAFWMQQSAPCYWLWEKLLFTLGGLMLPLAVYPQWMQKIASFTPFPAILGDRSALAVHFDFGKALHVTGVLTLWGLIGLSALAILYRKGLRILNITGG